MDLHHRLRSWNGAHYSAGAVAVRHDSPHRHPAFQDREEEVRGADDGLGRGLKIAVDERNVVTR